MSSSRSASLPGVSRGHSWNEVPVPVPDVMRTAKPLLFEDAAHARVEIAGPNPRPERLGCMFQRSTYAPVETRQGGRGIAYDKRVTRVAPVASEPGCQVADNWVAHLDRAVVGPAHHTGRTSGSGDQIAAERHADAGVRLHRTTNVGKDLELGSAGCDGLASRPLADPGELGAATKPLDLHRRLAGARDLERAVDADAAGHERLDDLAQGSRKRRCLNGYPTADSKLPHKRAREIREAFPQRPRVFPAQALV
jgi:hypothetical protein